MNEKQIIFRLSELETELERQKEELNNENDVYEQNKPVPPQKMIAQKVPYPKLVSNVKYDKVLGLIVPVGLLALGIILVMISDSLSSISTLFFWAAIILAGIVEPILYSNEKKKDIEAQKRAPEVLEKCREIDSINAENQKKLDEEYDRMLDNYKELSERHNNKWLALKREIENKIDNTTKELTSLYNSSKLIPKQYRDAVSLKEIYDIMDSADYTVKEAIQTFDRNRQLQLDAARLVTQNQANEIAAQQNELLAENNSIADRARREANIAAFVGAVQRHNTNKSLNNINKKL